MLKRISRRAIAIPMVLMGLTALMVVAVPSAASASSGKTLINVTTEQCMTNGGSVKNSAPITQYTCNGSGNQEWIYTGSTMVNGDNGKCLTDGGDLANSAPITQYTCNGSANQEWYQGGLGNGDFTIFNNYNMCMTTGGDFATSAPITQYTCNGSGNQLWHN